jgi:hypothetical protein
MMLPRIALARSAMEQSNEAEYKLERAWPCSVAHSFLCHRPRDMCAPEGLQVNRYCSRVCPGSPRCLFTGTVLSDLYST